MTYDELINCPDPVITPAQAATIMHCDRRLISRGIKDNTIPHIRLGRRIFIPRLAFIALFGTQGGAASNEY